MVMRNLRDNQELDPIPRRWSMVWIVLAILGPPLLILGWVWLFSHLMRGF